MSDAREAPVADRPTSTRREGGPRGADADQTTGRAVTALQAVLAAEHAAVYGYGVVGAHLSGGRREEAGKDWDAHRARRDELRRILRRRGAAPTPAASAYELPGQVRNGGDAVRLAVRLEEGVTRAYVGLVAVDDAKLRRFASLAVRESAIRAARWRGRSVPFPGLPKSVTR